MRAISLWKNEDAAILRKNNYLETVGERPAGITDDKWNEMGDNAIANIQLTYTVGILSNVVEEKKAKGI